VIIHQSIRNYLRLALILSLIFGCSRSEKTGQADGRDYNELIAIKTDIQPAIGVSYKLHDFLAQHPSSSVEWGFTYHNPVYLLITLGTSGVSADQAGPDLERTNPYR